MYNGKNRRPPNIRKQVILFIAVLLLLAGVYIVGTHFERKARPQERGIASANIGQLHRVEFDGATYVEKTGLTTILMMGVDNASGSQRYGARQGGQADFLLLLVIDHKGNTIHQLQIDRDTMAEVQVLGVLGNPVGTKSMQICLSHGFGVSDKDNCGYTLQAMENLLEGVEINLYLSFNMESIGIVNDALGGVTVTFDEDFTMYDPQMVKGATLTLTGEQAESFVRGRMDVGDGTNESRMVRHRTYMAAAMEGLTEQMREDTEYVGALYDELESVMTTNVSRGRMINEVNKAYKYEVLPVETLDGEYAVGADGFMEFHAADDAVIEWVMHTLYELQ